jgi:hypothetical protein
MTEYEIIDLMNSTQQSAIAASMGFMTISSAYVVVIQLLGKKLPFLYLCLLSSVYTLYVVSPIMYFFRAKSRMIYLAIEYKQYHETDPFIDIAAIAYYHPGVLIFIWLLSIMYTRHIRINNA